jgi:hypothetical protein
VSAPPFDTLNLGYHLGDDDEAVAENRARFVRALGVSAGSLFELHQVHGTSVREVAVSDRAVDVSNTEGDGLIARVPGQAVAARTADCVPVLIAHPPSGQVAAVHAGWRGAVAGIVPVAVEALSCNPAELIAAIGPHIRVDAFEIGEDVAAEMERVGGHGVVDLGRPRPHGDLTVLVRGQLRRMGLRNASIDDVGGCTHDDAAMFFSHRRDDARTGRHLSAIVARSPA